MMKNSYWYEIAWLWDMFWHFKHFWHFPNFDIWDYLLLHSLLRTQRNQHFVSLILVLCSSQFFHYPWCGKFFQGQLWQLPCETLQILEPTPWDTWKNCNNLEIRIQMNIWHETWSLLPLGKTLWCISPWLSRRGKLNWCGESPVSENFKNSRKLSKKFAFKNELSL